MICYFRDVKANDSTILGCPTTTSGSLTKFMGHRFVGRSIEFNVRWTAGDHTWEPYAHVKDLEALDHYYALMGVTRWQLLAKKAMIAGVDGSSHKRVQGSIKEKSVTLFE